MADKKSFPAKNFQQCTIRKVIEELYVKRKSGPRRFLVADEVGLGKTIVAKHVINHLREYAGRKVIIYVSSSLDITKQNRIKLAEHPEKEIVHADRINLLFEQKPLSRNLQIISMTPGTSLALGNSLGNAHERRYIATLIRYYYGGSYEKLAQLFCGYAHYDKFLESLRHYRINHDVPAVEARICRRWERITVGDGIPFIEAIKSRSLEDETKIELIKKIRQEMAEVILDNLKPDLVIFDEFQKFEEITAVDSSGQLTHKLGRILLKDETPTLLLSATPYRLYTGESPIFGEAGVSSHYKDLERAFTFLTGSPQKAAEIVVSIQKYGNHIQNINKDNVREILSLKNSIQDEVMKYMSRAERINFEGQNESYVKPVFLGDKYGGEEITKENILEFMKLAKHATSNGTLLTYWKSGGQSMSYMERYKLIEGAMEESEAVGRPLASDTELYSKLKESPNQHLKIKYLYDDILKNGSAYGYLWIPPIRSYYPGTGLFSNEKINTGGPKKGLVFSSWVFVPRMVTAELGAMRGSHFRKISSEKEIKPSGDSWAKLFFPSTLLASALSHQEFVSAKSYDELYTLARKRIMEALKTLGFEITEQGKTMPLYSLLAYCEFHDDEHKDKEYRKLLKGKRRWNVSSIREAGDYLYRMIPLSAHYEDLPLSPKTIDIMAEIAVSGPAVCFLRAINQLRKKDITWKSWLQLSSFCIHDIRSFVNRTGHIDAIMKYGKGNKPVNKAFNYFKCGNFQSVVDEYLYQIFSNKSDEGVYELLKKLSQIFGPTKAFCEIKTSRYKKERIYNDIVCCFGEGAEQSNSRDLNREAFNSPFWPFVLTTTSVGQEGLDFHLYCRDIYHWNLPTNPVDFEQREGRLNRFNNFMIRENIVKDQKIDASQIRKGLSIWDFYLDGARKIARRSDRYNLGMSPNWVFTPVSNDPVKFQRHIMDLPCSNDRDRYIRLMQDLDLYRLALGQPNQREFMEKLRDNSYYKNIDHRGITLNFFPHHLRDRKSEIDLYLESREELYLLVKDSLDYLIEIKECRLIKQLEFHVQRNIDRINKYYDGSNVSKSDFKASVEALYHFVDPFDDLSDRDPEAGFEDDLEKLMAA